MPKLTNKMRFPTTGDMAEFEETLRFVQWRKATGYDMHDTILHLLGIDHENLTFEPPATRNKCAWCCGNSMHCIVRRHCNRASLASREPWRRRKR